MNGGSLYTGSGGGAGVLRMFDLTQTYAQAMARSDMGWDVVGSPVGNLSSVVGWDSQRKQLVVRGTGAWAVYFPDENRWDNLTYDERGRPSAATLPPPEVVDVAGRTMYVLGDGLAESLNLDTYDGVISAR